MCLGVVATASALGAFDAPPPSREQIEADWLRQELKRFQPGGPTRGGAVSRAEDAAGGVDGVKNGGFGFHTAHEAQPWWQVDLQESVPIDRVVVYNRTELAGRNANLEIQVSDAGLEFETIHRHHGEVFLGFSDQKPLVVPLNGVSARFVRLSLPGRDYFHLDEVEVYPRGSEANVALNRPATQSSTSEWSARHAPLASPAARYPVAAVIERGLRLAESQRRLGARVESVVEALQQLRRQSDELAADTPLEMVRARYLRARWMVRELALRNPLLDFDRLVFVKRAPTMFPHLSDQHYGWWSQPGGGVYLLEGLRFRQPKVRCLTESLPAGNVAGLDLSFDGRRVLFAYARFHPGLADEPNKADKARVPEDAFYQLYEVGVDGGGLRQLTRGRYDDFDGRYLPEGGVLFLSTRKGLALQATPAYSDSTRFAEMPDSYVRCGGDNYRPVPVFTLHGMDGDGRNLRPLSAFENFEWTPSVANDGRILYTRWDYIDRFNGHFFSLWSANQDGTSPQLVYGNYTVRPQAVLEARAIPGSWKLIFTASAHHSITGGSLCLLDRALGIEFEAPLTRLTPEVCFPETEGQPAHYYASPWPLSEEYFLVGWADAPLPPHRRVTDHNNPTNAMGIYLYDAFGNLELLYRDPQISSMHPIPVASRRVPPTLAPLTEWSGSEGAFLLQDVSEGLEGILRVSVRRLRVVAVPPKVQPHMNQPELGVSREEPGKYVLGTVPVEADGSAYFRVPSGVSLFFQALDERGLALQTMRSLTYVMPGQTLSCVGCHEHRERAPAVTALAAARREPSRIRPGPEGSWPLRFDRLVQPVLDAQCVRCHSPDSTDPQAALPDLTLAKAWTSLLNVASNDLRKLACERDRSYAGEGTAANSRLWKLLTVDEGHAGVRLDAGARERLATWLDTYAQQFGHFSEAQERQLDQLRTDWAPLLEPSASRR